MYYEGLLTYNELMLPSNIIYIIDNNNDKYTKNNASKIEQLANSFIGEYPKLKVEYINSNYVSYQDLKHIILNQYHIPSNLVEDIINKANKNYNFDFWEILRNENICFEGPDLDIYNAFVIISFNQFVFQIYRVGLHSDNDAKSLGRLVFNEYDDVIREKPFSGFSGIGTCYSTRIESTPSDYVGQPLKDNDKTRLNIANSKIAEIVDNIKSMNREDGIDWLSRIIGNNMLEQINLQSTIISRLEVNDDLKLFLTDINNTEIKADPLTKTIYYLYLTNLDGIITAYLYEYNDVLLEIYKMISNRTDVKKLENSYCCPRKHFFRPKNKKN